jgi:cytochrome c biogenesis protein CcdA/thiol-disulfide isomerase/thioredoxin
MAVLLAFAFISGIVTILSPCILPVLPIVLSGGVGRGRARPFGVLLGFVASFTAFTLTLTLLVQSLGIPPDALRYAAVALIALLGLVMVLPRLREAFELLASRLATAAQRRRSRGGTREGPGAQSPPGFWSGILVGVSLGLVWTPCVGPIMASVIGLALTQRVDSGAVFITLAYSLGTSIPMLAVMLGGRALLARVPALTRNIAAIQRGFGVLMIVVALSIAAGWDRRVQSALLQLLPNYGSGLTAVENAAPVRSALEDRIAESAPQAAGSSGEASTFSVDGGSLASSAQAEGRLADYGPAPALVARGRWYNTQGAAGGGDGSTPLTMPQLRGRVVLVDFWTYSCVNCIRTIPHLRAWHERYARGGLVIIGVHTPEFEFEKSPENLARAIQDLGVRWPVVQDNDYAQWNAYRNRFWPAHYFIDARGRVRYYHFGEGAYEESERVIQELLREAGRAVDEAASAEAASTPVEEAGGPTSATPETYLGYGRGRGFVSAVQPVADQLADYRPARRPRSGEWNLEGRWTIAREYVSPDQAGVLELGFRARRVFLVVEPQEAGGSIEVAVDGKPGEDTADVQNGTLRPQDSRLYELVALPRQAEHVLRLEVKGRLRLFAFTFG